MDKSLEMLLGKAVNEIQILRRQNELMTVRLKMFDDIKDMLHARLPEQGMMHSEDIVQTIKNYIEIQSQINHNTQ